MTNLTQQKNPLELNIFQYNTVIKKLRAFFERLGFIEVPTQSRLSILAACEDPSTITPFTITNTCYPLPQTGQMWLEHELLRNPNVPGLFCMTTSYRDEKNPIQGRHNRIFPMFEFEARGDLNTLRQLEKELLFYLGFSHPAYFTYESLCEQYTCEELSAAHELRMQKEYGNVISLEYFPERTQPFWNMKSNADKIYNKIDVILHGMETIGSAERETSASKMRESFFSISGGEYAALLFKHFGRERVMAELEEYLALAFFPRFGGGIGVTRLVRAMLAEGLLSDVPYTNKVVAAANKIHHGAAVVNSHEL